VGAALSLGFGGFRRGREGFSDPDNLSRPRQFAFVLIWSVAARLSPARVALKHAATMGWPGFRNACGGI